MAKTYIDTVKYMVHGTLEIGGMVEKPDVVGALFGQTEGLLGDELDLRELQKNGRIGRIEVDLQARAGKSVGKITLPSSLDMVETSILAAALETVDRVGPYDAHIKVDKIEDTRNVKRRAVVDRAKELLKGLLTTEIPESKEISELVRQEVKVSEISEYGPERLPAGPGIASMDAIIVVEGRADVLNLLKNSMNNAVAIGGANVPKTLAGLCKEKEVTLFLDGDRGGDIILREIMSVADIDYVARAPAGKEVEELSRKEMIKALRARVPIEQVENAMKRNAEQPQDQRGNEGGRYDRFRGGGNRRYEPQAQGYPAQQQQAPSQPTYGREVQRSSAHDMQSIPAVPGIAPARMPSAPAPSESSAEIPQEFYASLGELENTARARMYDASNALKSEILVKDILSTLESSAGDVHSVVFDGVVTQRLADLAASKGVKVLLGVKVGNVFKKPESLTIGTKK
ncbi:MAG: DNA primase DnaG [Candidatus Micrarchaeia archaeon]